MLLLSPLRVHAPPIDHGDGLAWKDVIRDLLDVGVCLLDLQAVTAHASDSIGMDPIEAEASMDRIGHIPQLAFQSSFEILDWLGQASFSDDLKVPVGVSADADKASSTASNEARAHIPILDATSDSAHATGYHGAGAMSARYNAHREGLVFSNGQLVSVPHHPDFTPRCEALFRLMHTTANQVLHALDRHFGLSLPYPSVTGGTTARSSAVTNWFQQALGPTDRHSQWHIKRYVYHSMAAKDAADNVRCATDEHVLLPTHTDPSLISIVVLNRPGLGTQSGAMGLTYFHPVEQTWIEVPFSGHNVAIVLVGSVLQHITGGTVKACKHRVETDHLPTVGNEYPRRMAATLFVRPAPHAILSMIPSPALSHRQCKSLTFAQWNAKTARKYGKAKDVSLSTGTATS